MKRLLTLFAALAAGLGLATPSSAQVDPRGPLWDLIFAFQNCGPPQTYQMLSPPLFQAIYNQTGGSGCYADIRAAGPVVDMQVVDQQRLPLGTVSAIRVRHQGVTVDWFIGINDYTGMVEILTFQPAQSGQPRVERGPRTGGGGGGSNPGGGTPPRSPPSGGGTPSGGGGGGSSGGDSDGCRLYPSMC